MTEIQTLEAPYLEIGFYFAHLSEEDAFARLLKALAELGFQPGNKGYVHTEVGKQERTFASISDMTRHEVSFDSWMDVDNLLADSNTRLVQVVMNDMVNNMEVIVTYLSISPEAAQYDWHPVAIWSNGALFTGSLTKDYEKQAKARGKQAYQLLKNLVNRMKPSYATITVEEAVECPTDLARDSRSYAFSDFYIEKAFLGPSYFREVKKIFRDAYTELIGDGVYISCYKYFNPESHGLDNELVLSKSGKIARLIGARSRK